MSKKTKTIHVESFGEVTLSALGTGWMEENADDVVAGENEGTVKARIASGLRVVHASLQKKHPELTLEVLKEELLFNELTDLTSQVLALSGLSVPGGAMPENPSQGSSSAS